MAVADITGPLTPRLARREATRLSITKAVETLLTDRPYGELRVEDVMAEAGLTRTAFYRYFPDLESVLLASLVSVGSEITEAANRWLLLDADPLDGILAAATGLAEVWSRHRALLSGFFDASTSGSRIQLAWHDLVESFIEPVQMRLDDLARRGRTTLVHPGETARALVWMNERYLSETFTRDLDVSVDVAASTLADIWRRVLFTESQLR